MNFKGELIKNILFKAVNTLLTLAVTVLMVRLLGPTGNGFYSLFIANTAIITLIISLSLNSGLMYYTAKKQFSQTTLFNTAILILLIQLVLIIILGKIFEIVFGFSFYVNPGFSGIAFWGCTYLASLLLNGYVSAFFVGNKWFDRLNILTVLINVIFVLVFGIFFLKGFEINSENTVLVLKIYILLTAFQALLNVVVYLKEIKFRFTFSFLHLKQLKLVFTYAGVAFFCNLFQFFAYRMDYWFIDFFRNKEELGLYALASRLSQVLWMIPITIAAVVIPFTVTASVELKEKVKLVIRLLFNGYLMVGAILIFLSPVFIPFIFGSSFLGTVLPFIILLPGVIIFSINTVLAAYFAGINRLDINLKISFFCFLIILLGDFFLVPGFGKEGAAIASCLGYSFSGVYSLFVFSRQSQEGFKELLLIKRGDFRIVQNIFRDKLIING